MSPPERATTPPNLPPCLAAYSDTRQAPCEKPRSTTRSRGTPASMAVRTTASIAASAEESQGSFRSGGARNVCGYQTLRCAPGARKDRKSGVEGEREGQRGRRGMSLQHNSDTNADSK